MGANFLETKQPKTCAKIYENDFAEVVAQINKREMPKCEKGEKSVKAEKAEEAEKQPQKEGVQAEEGRVVWAVTNKLITIITLK